MARRFKISDGRLTRKSLVSLVSVLREDRALLEAEIKTAWACATRFEKRCMRLENEISKLKGRNQ